MVLKSLQTIYHGVNKTGQKNCIFIILVREVEPVTVHKLYHYFTFCMLEAQHLHATVETPECSISRYFMNLEKYNPLIPNCWLTSTERLPCTNLVQSADSILAFNVVLIVSKYFEPAKGKPREHRQHCYGYLINNFCVPRTGRERQEIGMIIEE